MSAEFIKMISEVHAERFDAHMKELANKKTPCGIFFGFEVESKNVVREVQSLLERKVNLSCVIVLSDVETYLLEGFVDVPVIAIEDFSRFGEVNFPAKPQEIIIINFRDLAFTDYFANNGMEVLIYSEDEQFLSMTAHFPELYSVYEMLGSDESKEVFRAAIKGRVTGKLSDYRFSSEKEYFLEGFTPTAGDIAIDGGAYDGATAIAFAKCGAKVFAFEMVEATYKKCLNRLERSGEDIILENLGLSDKESVENYEYNVDDDAASKKESTGTFTGNFIDLDTYVAKKNLPRVDFIKLDVEGAELETLHGAAKTITRCKPKMAVSAYHKLEDLWTLATYIKSLRPDYEFEFRHYRISDCNFNDEERAVLKYFGLSYLVPTNCSMILYCR